MAQPPRRRVRGHSVFGLYMRIMKTLATNAPGTDKRTTVNCFSHRAQFSNPPTGGFGRSFFHIFDSAE